MCAQLRASRNPREPQRTAQRLREGHIQGCVEANRHEGRLTPEGPGRKRSCRWLLILAGILGARGEHWPQGACPRPSPALGWGTQAVNLVWGCLLQRPRTDRRRQVEAAGWPAALSEADLVPPTCRQFYLPSSPLLFPVADRWGRCLSFSSPTVTGSAGHRGAAEGLNRRTGGAAALGAGGAGE